MATTRTILILTYWSPLVIVRPVLAGMAARTIRLIRRVGPGNHFSIGLVAGRTGEVATVIERLERRRRVPELIRCKRIGVVADVAFLGGHEVAIVLAGGGYAVVTR